MRLTALSLPNLVVEPQLVSLVLKNVYTFVLLLGFRELNFEFQIRFIFTLCALFVSSIFRDVLPLVRRFILILIHLEVSEVHIGIDVLALAKAYTVLEIVYFLDKLRSLIQQIHHGLPLLLLLLFELFERKFGLVVLFDVAAALDIVSAF